MYFGSRSADPDSVGQFIKDLAGSGFYLEMFVDIDIDR